MTKTREKDINANDRLRKEFKATIVVGLPASGRSANIVRPLSREQAAFVLDSNEMNKLIPEYMGGLGACLVHEEGKMLTEQAFKEFTRGSMKGVNLVIPVVGSFRSWTRATMWRSPAHGRTPRPAQTALWHEPSKVACLSRVRSS